MAVKDDARQAEERAAQAAVATTAIRQASPLLMASQGLRIPDQEIARVLGIAPTNIYLWRTGQQRIPRKHLPAIAALTVITFAKSQAQATVVGAPAEVLGDFEALRQLLDRALEPVLRDADLRKKYQRLLARMVKAVRSAEGQRVLADEMELLVKQLAAAGKAH